MDNKGKRTLAHGRVGKPVTITYIRSCMGTRGGPMAFKALKDEDGPAASAEHVQKMPSVAMDPSAAAVGLGKIIVLGEEDGVTAETPAGPETAGPREQKPDPIPVMRVPAQIEQPAEAAEAPAIEKTEVIVQVEEKPGSRRKPGMGRKILGVLAWPIVRPIAGIRSLLSKAGTEEDGTAEIEINVKDPDELPVVTFRITSYEVLEGACLADGERIVIGKAEHCTLRNEGAEDQHAIMTRVGDEVFISNIFDDVETIVDGKRLEPEESARVFFRSRVEIGKCEYYLVKSTSPDGRILDGIDVKILDGAIRMQSVQDDVITIGSGESCALTLADGHVPETQLKLEVDEEAVRAVLMENTCHTLIGGKELKAGEERVLEVGAEIRMGNTKLEITDISVGRQAEADNITLLLVNCEAAIPLKITLDAGKSGELVFGRNEGTDAELKPVPVKTKEGMFVGIPERNVSREHAKLSFSGGKLIIEDLDSYNGTKLNGIPILAPVKVRMGDRIHIGDYSIVLKGED